MTPEIRNILSGLPSSLTGEVIETIVASPALCIERITSRGQVTPEDECYNQERDEWVLVLAGRADLLFVDVQETRRLVAGDYTLIPAGCRHRVSWSDPAVETVWLAVHFNPAGTP